MKKAAIALLIAAFLASSGIIYPQVMIITDIHDDIVTLETCTGLVYELHGAEDWEIGDTAAVLMYNGLTPRAAADDVIITARYSSFELTH